MSKHGDAIIRLTAALAEKDRELAELRKKVRAMLRLDNEKNRQALRAAVDKPSETYETTGSFDVLMKDKIFNE